MEKVNANETVGAGVGQSSDFGEELHAIGYYTVECVDEHGNVKWTDTVPNLVTTAGKNDLLDKYLSGSAYTAVWYLGLISSTGYSAIAAADTAASHAGWTEDTNYSQSTRPAPSFAAAASGQKATSSVVSFTISASVTIKGCFLISNNTKGGTSGILLSAGLFSGGDKVLSSPDTLNVSYTLSV